MTSLAIRTLILHVKLASLVCFELTRFDLPGRQMCTIASGPEGWQGHAA